MGEYKTISPMRALSLALALGAFALQPRAAHATGIIWDAGGGADEHWSTAANWDNGDTIPGATDTASLNGVGKNATYDSSVLPANQTPALVTVGNQNTFGTLSINSGTLTIATNFIVGGFHKGTVNQSGGAVTVQAGGVFRIAASDPDANGSSYNLSGGTFETRNTATIGNVAGASFTQTGGTWTVNAATGTRLLIGNADGISGSYDISGATSVSNQKRITIAAANTYNIGGSGQLVISGGTLNADLIDKSNAAVTGTTAFLYIFGGAVNVGDLEITPSFFDSSPAATPATLNAGTVGVNLNMGRISAPTNKARLAPGGLGAIGTTTFASGTTLTENTAACILAIDISGATSDLISMNLTNGVANLNGFLDVNVVTAATLPYYDVLSAATINGALTLTDPAHYSYAIVPGAGSSQTLRVFIPEPGTTGMIAIVCGMTCAKRTRRSRN